MSNEEVCIGVEVSSSAMRAVSVAGKTVRTTASAPIVHTSSVVEQLTAFIERCRSEFGGAAKIGVSVPALVGPGRRVVEYSTHIAEFSSALAKMGLRKLYPDAIAHALYYVLKHGVELSLDDNDLKEIVALDDCIANVLLLEYATRHKRAKVVSAIKKRATEIKTSDKRERDKQWLLIYQLWSAKELKDNAQAFLSELKTKDFKFLDIPTAKGASTT